MEKEAKIKCPNCGFDLNVNEILYTQLEEELGMKFRQELTEEKKKFQSQTEALQKEKDLVEEEKKKILEQIEEGVNKKLKTEKELLVKTLRKELEEEESEKYGKLQEELNEKSEKVKELNRIKVEMERLKREKEEMKESILAETEKLFNENLLTEKEKIRKSEQDRNELVIKELQKKLEDQKKLTEEMQRKQKQGSMQLQGEVQELAIEEYLRTNFPLDSVLEIKKGQMGADCIQTVNTHTRTNCGQIYYESKRTKIFGGDWIEKFKTDMREKKITVGILVSQVYPKNMERMGMVEGIWICNYEEFKGLSAVIRELVIRISEATASQENKGDKMVMLYDYLTGSVFRSQIEAIVEGFTQMKRDLDSEKIAMNKLWSTRESQINKVIINTVSMYGSVKGIGGQAISTIPALELVENAG